MDRRGLPSSLPVTVLQAGLPGVRLSATNILLTRFHKIALPLTDAVRDQSARRGTARRHLRVDHQQIVSWHNAVRKP